MHTARIDDQPMLWPKNADQICGVGSTSSLWCNSIWCGLQVKHWRINPFLRCRQVACNPAVQAQKVTEEHVPSRTVPQQGETVCSSGRTAPVLGSTLGIQRIATLDILNMDCWPGAPLPSWKMYRLPGHVYGACSTRCSHRIYLHCMIHDTAVNVGPEYPSSPSSISSIDLWGTEIRMRS